MAGSRNDAEFSSATRRTIAERVAWRCSFPGCGRNTVGPHPDNKSDSSDIGIAAHIHGAARGDKTWRPAPDDMSQAAKKDISNGIWLCPTHHRVIDRSNDEFSPETLRAWRDDAENRARKSRDFPAAEYIASVDDSRTLVQIGDDNVFHATWLSIESNGEWTFCLIRAEIGDLKGLRDYISMSPKNRRYIVVESQGDARLIDNISLDSRSKAGEQQHVMRVTVQDRVGSEDPNDIPLSDVRLDEEGDLPDPTEGEWQYIGGMDAAKQWVIETLRTVPKNSLPWDREVGSYAGRYYDKYRSDLEMMSRMMRVDMIRMSLIPYPDDLIDKGSPKPQWSFVRRILKVVVPSAELQNGKLNIEIEIEWGNGEFWSHIVPTSVCDYSQYASEPTSIEDAINANIAASLPELVDETTAR